MDELRQLWAGALEPVRKDLLGPHVSARTRAFLTAVGLPRANRLDFAFYHDERLLAPVERAGREYFVFGDSTGTVLFGVEAGRDAVCTLHPDGPFMFVNASIEAFLYCYGEFTRVVDAIVETPFADRAPMLAELRARIDARDPDALDPDGLLSAWDDILEPYGELR